MPPERRAVLLVLGLAVVGQGLRTWLGMPGDPPGAVRILGGGIPGAPRAHRDSSVAFARPLRPGERVDLDRAPAAEIARLPRVGLTLARAIVSHRTAHGPFGNLEALDRVPGVGPGLLAAIAGQVSFSAGGRLSPPPAQPGQPRPWGAPAEPLNLNRATAAELEGLPFVGPFMARQIVAFRDRHGPFPAVDSLVKVPGIGPATVGKVRDRVRVE
jgi:competence protein ComEA